MASIIVIAPILRSGLSFTRSGYTQNESAYKGTLFYHIKIVCYFLSTSSTYKPTRIATRLVDLWKSSRSYKGYWSDKFMTILIILSISSMFYYLRSWHRLGVFYVLKVSEANKLWRRGKQKSDSEKNTIELA